MVHERILMPLPRLHPRRQVLAWLAAGTALLQGCDHGTGPGPNSSFRGLDITGASYGRGFSLTDHTGRVRTLADFRGQVVMLYFGFVQCPDVRPTALTRAAARSRWLRWPLAAWRRSLVTSRSTRRWSSTSGCRGAARAG